MTNEAPTPTTYFHQQALLDPQPGGRYRQRPVRINGSDPVVVPPAAPAWSHDPCGPEPPLGYSVDEVPDMERVR
jgi:hypothetical protein